MKELSFNSKIVILILFAGVVWSLLGSAVFCWLLVRGDLGEGRAKKKPNFVHFFQSYCTCTVDHFNLLYTGRGGGGVRGPSTFFTARPYPKFRGGDSRLLSLLSSIKNQSTKTHLSAFGRFYILYTQ